jgi:NADPH2:quinone reductase
MRAALVRQWGRLEAGELPKPAPGPGEVLIAIAAAGVNFADTLLVAGKYQEKPAFPFAAGLEAGGTVAACGPGATRFKPGDRVMTTAEYGAFAEFAAVPENDAFAIPAGMDFVTAAGFPVIYGTAHLALTRYLRLRAGETLVVHGAGGGAGLAAVECGKALGATVIATAGSPEKLALAKAHGADHGIDYSREDLRQRIKELAGGEGADAAFDPVGGDAFDASLRSTKWGGRIAVIGFASGRVPQIPANILLVKNLAVHGVYWGGHRKRRREAIARGFAALLRWYAEGKLRPHVSHRVPLAEAARALELLAARRAQGKVVVTVTP